MFAPATKKNLKLRCAIFGPSGSGKTFSALRIATGIAKAASGKIAVIDTERGSASKYSDRFKFDVCELPTFTVDSYVQAITEAGRAGYNVLIIDSMSHAWEELLQEVEKIAQTRFRGNTWSAWSEGTPIQRKFIDAILDFPGHIISTMRSDTEWAVENQNGKNKPVKVGLKPRQGKGIEYEFDLLMEGSPDHVFVVSKDRTGKFQDEMIAKPGEEFGEKLAAWLGEGVAAPAKEIPAPAQSQLPSSAPSPLDQLKAAIVANNISEDTQVKWCGFFKVDCIENMTAEHIAKILKKIESTKKAA